MKGRFCIKKKKKIIGILLTSLITLCLTSALAFAASAAESTYLRGDADGNGIVDVKDVTTIQSVLAEITDDSDKKIELRADINGDGLDISDATEIQMNIAGYENIWHIGEKAAYPQPTTEPQTTKKPVPTKDPYELPIIFN